MNRRLYTKEEILAVANEMAARGEDPTTLAVYAYFGKRGSLNRIQDVLEARTAELKERAEAVAPASPLPTHAEEVVAAWAAEQVAGGKQAGAKLWTLAHADAETTLGPLREELAKEKAEAVKAKVDSRALVEAMEGQVNEMVSVQEDMEGKLAQAHETIGSLRKELESLAAVQQEAERLQCKNTELFGNNQRLSGQVQGLQADLATAQRDLEATRDDLVALKVEKGTLRFELDAANAAAKKARQEAEGAEEAQKAIAAKGQDQQSLKAGT